MDLAHNWQNYLQQSLLLRLEGQLKAQETSPLALGIFGTEDGIKKLMKISFSYLIWDIRLKFHLLLTIVAIKKTKLTP